MPASAQPSRSFGPTNSSVPTRSAIPIRMPTTPSQPGRTVVERIDAADEQRPQAGEQVAEVLADAHAEEPVERGEDHRDRLPGGVTAGPSGAATYRRASSGTANGQRTRPRPWTSAATAPDDHGQDRERRRRPEHDGEQGRQREHQQGAQQQGLPPEDEAGSAGIETPQDLVRLLAEDVRIVECPAELEEGHVESDRHHDQEEGGEDLNGHGVGPCASSSEPLRRWPPLDPRAGSAGSRVKSARFTASRAGCRGAGRAPQVRPAGPVGLRRRSVRRRSAPATPGPRP